VYEKSEKIISLPLARLAPLLGIWRGAGHGKFPTIAAFDYTEEITFLDNSVDQLIHFEQKTWVKSSNQDNGKPLHWESGFIRPLEDGSVEMSNAQNGGRVEVLKGQIDEAAYLQGTLLLSLNSILLGNDPRLIQTTRRYTQRGNTLSYTVEMATVKTPQLQQHLEAVLTKTDEISI